jgi:hypothetical protein
MVSVEIYVEGGGQGKHLKSRCREGFREFFRKAGLEGHMPRIKACGSRNDTLDDFRGALRLAGPAEKPLLLVDSEDPVKSNGTPWQHLCNRDGWERPNNAQDNQAHLMVQCMESWFLADVSALAMFFGAGFKSTSIANRDDIENVPKKDVFNQLNSASSASRKGAYDKGRDSFDILARIDPEEVIKRSKFAKRLVNTLKGHLIPT